MILPATQGEFEYPVAFDYSMVAETGRGKWMFIRKLEKWLEREIGPLDVEWCSLHYAETSMFYFLEQAHAIRFQLEMGEILASPDV